MSVSPTLLQWKYSDSSLNKNSIFCLKTNIDYISRLAPQCLKIILESRWQWIWSSSLACEYNNLRLSFLSFQKSSFNKFDALSKKSVLHVRSVDTGKVQQQLNSVSQVVDRTWKPGKPREFFLTGKNRENLGNLGRGWNSEWKIIRKVLISIF